MLQKLSKKAVFQDTLRFLFLLAKARYKNFITFFSLLPLSSIKDFNIYQVFLRKTSRIYFRGFKTKA